MKEVRYDCDHQHRGLGWPQDKPSLLLLGRKPEKLQEAAASHPSTSDPFCFFFPYQKGAQI